MQAVDTHASSARLLSTDFDEDGFLTDPAQWTEELAEQLAQAAGVGPLGQDHWTVIHVIRDKYLNRGEFPLMRHLCRVLGLRPYAVKGLFSGCRNLWRIAGLPHPGEEAKAYMD